MRDSNLPNAARLAVLIDADNVSVAVLPELFKAAENLGEVVVRHAYGDWSKSTLSPWRDATAAHCIRPIQQFAHVSGKGSTDIALVIDAMDLLHSGEVDGFCLVSSDCDFTRLALRLREGGKVVYGFGRKETTKAFRSACTRFIDVPAPAPQAKTAPNGATNVVKLSNAALQKKIVQALSQSTDPERWATLGWLGTKLGASFCKGYGYTRLVDLLKAQNYLEFDKSTPPKVRVKPSLPAKT